MDATIASILALLAVLPAAPQKPPTATEAFDLPIRCMNLGAQKLESVQTQPMSIVDGASMGMAPAAVTTFNEEYVPELIDAHYSSKYDPVNNRCYAEIYIHTRTERFDIEQRQLYEANMDDLLASATIQNGKKRGNVFDHENHRTITFADLGWEDANAYIDEMMADKRR
jgi:hypothetical protein